MKLYTFYTKSYEGILNEWFLPSIKDNFEIIKRCVNDGGKESRYGEESWNKLMQEKSQFIVEAIKENRDRLFVFSDPDVVFLRSIESTLLVLKEDRDLLFQKSSPDGMLCAGFFACVGNAKTLKLWEDIPQRANRDKTGDQKALNALLNGNSYLKAARFVFSRNISMKLSKSGINSYGVRWGYFPNTFLGGGTLTGKSWSPGIQLDIPKETVMFHANYTVGLENKVALLKYVTNILNGSK